MCHILQFKRNNGSYVFICRIASIFSSRFSHRLERFIICLTGAESFFFHRGVHHETSICDFLPISRKDTFFVLTITKDYPTNSSDFILCLHCFRVFASLIALSICYSSQSEVFHMLVKTIICSIWTCQARKYN